MVEREKLIRAMEYCTGDIVPVDENDECLGDVCPFKEGGYESGDCQENMIRAALALLREQEPRVLTVEEIRSGAVEVAWIEDADKAEVIPGIWFRLSNKGGDEAVDIHIRDGFVGARLEVYGKLWRCWSARPTEEQRKAAKWDWDET